MADEQNGSSKPTSTHRLPTVSATEALRAAKEESSTLLSFGFKNLDALLSLPGDDAMGGLATTQLIELTGPPGVGKTTLCMQAAASALHLGHKVVWVDAHTHLVGPRFKRILEGANNCESQDSKISSKSAENFLHLTTPTLPHLLALVLHRPSSFPPEGTRLVIVDSISTLLDNEFSRDLNHEDRAEKPEGIIRSTGQRKLVVAAIASKLSQLAATCNLTVLVTSKVTTKIIAGVGAFLRPAISSQEWENAFHSRLTLYSDWVATVPEGEQSKPVFGVVRFAKVIGPRIRSDESKAVAFTINDDGVHEVRVTSCIPNIQALDTSSSQGRKRTYAEAEHSEGSGSESSYGWPEDDSEVIAAEGLVGGTYEQSDL